MCASAATRSGPQEPGELGLSKPMWLLIAIWPSPFGPWRAIRRYERIDELAAGHAIDAPRIEDTADIPELRRDRVLVEDGNLAGCPAALETIGVDLITE